MVLRARQLTGALLQAQSCMNMYRTIYLQRMVVLQYTTHNKKNQTYPIFFLLSLHRYLDLTNMNTGFYGIEKFTQ